MLSACDGDTVGGTQRAAVAGTQCLAIRHLGCLVPPSPNPINSPLVVASRLSVQGAAAEHPPAVDRLAAQGDAAPHRRHLRPQIRLSPHLQAVARRARPPGPKHRAPAVEGPVCTPAARALLQRHLRRHVRHVYAGSADETDVRVQFFNTSVNNVCAQRPRPSLPQAHSSPPATRSSSESARRGHGCRYMSTSPLRRPARLSSSQRPVTALSLLWGSGRPSR